LALVADAQHSFADSISSVGVLVGLFLTRWVWWADGVTAILVGLFVLYETWGLGKEVTDNLLDVSDVETEAKIKKICQEQEIELLDLKTRKIGSQIFAELKIGLNENWRMEKVEKIIKALEDLLKEKIPSLQFVVISVISHQLRQGYIKSKTGQIKCFKEVPSKVNLKKLGYRVVIPLDEQGKVNSTFGASKYLIVDIKNKKEVQREIIKNPYFVIGRAHGVRFIREVKADEVRTPEIGEHAKEGLKEVGIKIKIISREVDFDKILKSLLS
jgi:predicted Fe-Mo cluster-binding NifX family protein